MIRSISPKNFDWFMFPIICLILTVGIFFIWSASSEKFVFKQLVWVLMGFTIFFTLLYFDYLSFAHYAYIIYACVLFLLLLLLVLGGSVKGSQRWFSIGSFSIQPSEFMKITLVLTLARFLRYKKYGLGLFDIGISLLLTFIPMAFYYKAAGFGHSAGHGSYFTFYSLYCRYPALSPPDVHLHRASRLTFTLDVSVKAVSENEDHRISLA